MTNEFPPPAPKANERLDLGGAPAAAPNSAEQSAPVPAPASDKQVHEPVGSSSSTAAQATPAATPSLNSAPTSPASPPEKKGPGKRFRGIRFTLSIVAFYLSLIPFVGLIANVLVLTLSILGLKVAGDRKKLLIAAIVISSIGAISSLGASISFLSYMGSH